MDGWAWWLLLLGIAIGVFLAWLALASGAPLPEADEGSWAEPAPESDEDAWARPPHESARMPEPMPAWRDPDAEAAWISRTIESRGGIAPAPLVQEVLDLHDSWSAEGAPPWPEAGPSWSDPDALPPPALPRPRT